MHTPNRPVTKSTESHPSSSNHRELIHIKKLSQKIFNRRRSLNPIEEKLFTTPRKQNEVAFNSSSTKPLRSTKIYLKSSQTIRRSNSMISQRKSYTQRIPSEKIVAKDKPIYHPYQKSYSTTNLSNLKKNLGFSQTGDFFFRPKWTDSFKAKLEKEVYTVKKEVLDDLEKKKHQKNEKNVEAYQKSLLRTGFNLFSNEALQQLNQNFIAIKKKSDTNIHSNIMFIKRVEKKEKKIIAKINRNQELAKKLLKRSGQIVHDFEFKKIKFCKVLD